MLALDRLFPRKVCINLQRRPDRWQRMLDQFRLHGLRDVIRHDAADGRVLNPPAAWEHSPGAYGCLRSHLEVVRHARNKGDPAILILEDDVIFHPDFRQRFEQSAAQVPADWDAIYLGGIHVDDPVPVSPGVVRLKSTFSTYAYGLRNTAYAAFLDDGEKQLRPVDHTTRALQREFHIYCFLPHLAWVTEDHSDIKNSNVNPWLLMEPVAMKGESIQRMLSRTVVILLTPESGGAAENRELVQCVTGFYAEMNLRVRFLPASQEHSTTIHELMEDSDEYAVIADLAVYPYQWEFKASLLKCLEFERVLPLHRPFPLSLEDTSLVMRRRINDVHALQYERMAANGGHREFCILSRTAISAAAGREPTTFHSPARLLRLHPDGKPI